MTDSRAFLRAAVATGTIAMIVTGGCGMTNQEGSDGDAANQEPGTGGGTGTGTGGAGGTGTGTGGGVPVPAAPGRFEVRLIPEGASGVQRINFAVPLARGALAQADAIAVFAGGVAVPAARRALARYPDDSLRSVQVQFDLDVTAHRTVSIEVGETGAGGVQLVPVADTLAGTGADVHPRVWAVLPNDVLAASAVAGPIVPRAAIANTPIDAWSSLCDYDRWDTDAFLAGSASRDVWLFDRVTTMYRGHVFTGEQSPLRSAYREAVLYRDGMTIQGGVATDIPIPTAQDDLKYYYSQGMALHYLLTGDDRFREAAEAVSARVETMWNPHYDGSDRFWTERHAGFALLAHEWAALVTDDLSTAIEARAEDAATAFLAIQAAQPAGYTDPDARCFAHSADAHGEGFGYFGCSPWMSAILADGLDAHARRVGGTRATQVRASLAQLGRIIARDGRDTDGRPYYWMGVGNPNHEVDDYEEHWGESAYLTAMAWDASGRTDAALKTATDELLTGLRERGVVGHTRSFNWQCRSAIMAPAFLK